MKKIIKLSKKIILFALIIVFPINSFAAVSVSDGSAFVSKSEFAASLNNISNRMSQIENTLDAKIDSLVSSYLSRNGIWNGDECEFVGNTSTTGKCIVSAALRDAADVSFYNKNDSGYNTIYAKHGSIDTVYGFGGNHNMQHWWRFIPNTPTLMGLCLTWKCNKTGLLVANLLLSGRDPESNIEIQAYRNQSNHTFYAINTAYAWYSGKIEEQLTTTDYTSTPAGSLTDVYCGAQLNNMSIKGIIQQTVTWMGISGTTLRTWGWYKMPINSDITASEGTTAGNSYYNLSDAVGTGVIFLSQGTYVNSFFVSKGEYVSLVKYKNFVGPGYSDYLFYNGTAGGEMQIADYKLSVY